MATNILQQPELLLAALNIAAMRTIRITFDGGTPCNIPRLGYGNGYGSYQIDGGRVITCDFNRPMSANAAEIWTAVFAVNDVTRHQSNLAEACLHFQGDSRIALKYCLNFRRSVKFKSSSSGEFRDAILALHSLLPAFRDVKASWWPRENSVRIFGH